MKLYRVHAEFQMWTGPTTFDMLGLHKDYAANGPYAAQFMCAWELADHVEVSEDSRNDYMILAVEELDDTPD